MSEQSEHADWAAQEKARRAKFSWGQRRLEDGKMVGFTIYQIGGVVVAAMVVIIPWTLGVREIWKHFF